jgi:cell division protein FtsI/penicillin-binding protein 2
MVSLKQITSAVVLLLVVTPWPGHSETTSKNNSDSLFSQTVAELLNHEFPSADISFLLLDARSGRVLASRWQHPERPIPLGSLAKPFTALAYGESHQSRFPIHICHGTAGGCWRPVGHGTLNLTSAIAYSCNSYFRVLAAGLNAQDVSLTASRFGLEPPDPSTSGPALAGLGDEWRISALHMAGAYVELMRGHEQPVIAQILRGMAESASLGTAAEVDHSLSSGKALAKTGTAPCTHQTHAPGDGFTVALFPADNPRLLLMVRVHGVPGSVAAKTAGQMLRRIEN